MNTSFEILKNVIIQELVDKLNKERINVIIKGKGL